MLRLSRNSTSETSRADAFNCRTVCWPWWNIYTSPMPLFTTTTATITFNFCSANLLFCGSLKVRPGPQRSPPKRTSWDWWCKIFLQAEWRHVTQPTMSAHWEYSCLHSVIITNTCKHELYNTNGTIPGNKIIVAPTLNETDNTYWVPFFFHFNGHFPGGPGLAGTQMSPFCLLLGVNSCHTNAM